MIERFTETKHTLARLRASEGAEHLDAFAEALFGAGYTRRSGIRYLNAAARLGNWCKGVGMVIEQIDNGALPRFLDYLSRCRCRHSTCDRRRDTRAGETHFVEYLPRGKDLARRVPLNV